MQPEMNLEFLSPAFTSNNIPIVFNVDEGYAGYFSVTLQSLLETASEENNYDLIILQKKLPQNTKTLLHDQIGGRCNFSLRFFFFFSIATSGCVNIWCS